METVSSPAPEPGAVPGDFPLPLLVVLRLGGAFRREFAAEMAGQEWAAEVDAAPPMYGVLRAAGYLDAPSQRDIAATIWLDPSDLVAVLDRMERNGWVTRERDPADRRRSLVRVTADGRAALDRYNAVARRAGERIMSDLDDEERAVFTGLAMRMLRASGDTFGVAGRGRVLDDRRLDADEEIGRRPI